MIGVEHIIHGLVLNANFPLVEIQPEKTSALNVAQKWIWRNDDNEPDDAMVCTKKQMIDIGGMETIFVVMGG